MAFAYPLAPGGSWRLNPILTDIKRFSGWFSGPGWLFWGGFWALNWLLFAPIYLFQWSEMSFWPWSDMGRDWGGLFLQRENLDIFRFNVEFGLLTLCWLLLSVKIFSPSNRGPDGGTSNPVPNGERGIRRNGGFFTVAAFAFYLLQLIYAIYEGFIRAFYQLEPNGFNDWPMLAKGTAYVIQSLNLPLTVYLGGLLLVLLAGGLLFALHRLLFDPARAEQLSVKHGLALGLVVLFALVAGWRGEVEMARPAAAVSSFAAKLSQNIALSQATKNEASRFAILRLAPFYEFAGYELAYKPNIHIIFIESYGSVLYKRDDFQAAYTSLLPFLEKRLDKNGWSVHTTLSDAPTWGGGSWIAYTSFLFGLPLESDNDYRQLLAQYEERPFPHLPNYLRDQGYRSYRLTSSANELNDLEWRRLVQFFGVDEWLRYGDIPYDGPLYGWGPSLPDQYALNYGLAFIKANETAPYTLFFITQNSHYPWYPLPEFTADWRSLNDTPEPEPSAPSVSHPELRRRYLASIEYELEMLVEMIISQGEADDIFILIGDHQPARVARYADGWDTPIHIISRDAAFTAAFEPFDFVPGLMVGTIEPKLHHAGFYSLFSRILAQQYGHSGAALPIYRPLGADLESGKQ
jgi:hypothetical protein